LRNHIVPENPLWTYHCYGNKHAVSARSHICGISDCLFEVYVADFSVSCSSNGENDKKLTTASY